MAEGYEWKITLPPSTGITFIKDILTSYQDFIFYTSNNLSIVSLNLPLALIRLLY